MAPSTDVCVLCSAVFYGRQENFRCTSCKKRAHSKCIQLPDMELQAVKTGERPFQCNLCLCSASEVVSRPSDDSVHESLPATQPPDPQNSAPRPGDLGGDATDIREMLLHALEGLSFLTDEVAKLREANDRLSRENARAFAQQSGIIASLRAEVRSLRGERLPRLPRAGPLPPERPAPPSTPELNVTMATPSTQRVDLSSFATVVAKINAASTLSANEQLTPAPSEACLLLNDASGKPPSNDSAQSNKRRGSAVCVGASDACSISVVRPSKRPRHIFVSKLSPSTTSAQLTEHLSTVHVIPLACQRLKTKYSSYSSFCVTVDEDSFERLSDPLFWPKGCLFKPFRGKLHPEMFCSTDVPHDEKN